MTNKKSTKKALITSALCLLLCVSMLVGATFAWFTDSVSTTNNIITAGNLDVNLYWSTNGNDWTPVDANTNIFKTGTLWEPGHTEVVYLKVVNEGTLALKYDLQVNVASEIEGTNVAGNTFKLSDYILYNVTNGVTTFADSAAARGNETGNKLNAPYNKAATLEAGQEVELTMVVFMPTTVGNEANYLKDTAIPTINLGINLFATQQVAESDSFGPDYDENAPFSVWDGVVPTEMPESLVVDGETQIVHVKDAAAFAYLSTLSAKWVEFYTDGNGTSTTNYRNGAGTNYYYSGQWTVSLEADIDLNNYPIEPVQIVFGQNCGYSAFNGNNHVIRNINTTTGLFADMTRTSYANLVLENVKATKGALTGASGSFITNVTVKNATISGENYVGGLTGRAFSSVTNCEVFDSSVVATGKEAGGLIGYAEATSAGSTISDNTVKNVSVYANNRAAGLVAQPNTTVKVYNNTVDTVTVGAEDTSEYQPGAVVSNALTPDVYDNTVINANVLGTIDIVDKPEDLKAAVNNAQSGDTIILGDGEYSLPSLSGKEGITIDGGEGAVIGGENASTGFGSNFGKNTTIKNVTFSGSSNGVRYSYAQGGTTIFENCTFAGDSTYGFHIDESKGATFIFNNCTFSGFNAFAGDLEKVTFNGCTFLHNGSYGHTNIWSVGEFNDCTWGEGATYGTRGDGVIYIDGKLLVDSAEQLREFAANATGDVEILLDTNITLGDDTTQKSMGAYFPNATSVTIFGNDKTLTLKGQMPGADWHAQYYAGIIAPNATVTVKDLTIVNEKLGKDGLNYSADRESVYTMVRGTSVLFENVDFIGGVQVVNNTKFVGCTFEENVLVANDAGYATNGKFCVFIDFEYNADGVCTVDFEGCTFNASGYGCVKAAGNKGAKITVNVKDCSFTNTCPSNNWSQSTPKYDVKMTGSNITVNDLGGNDWDKGFGNG